MSDQLFRNTTGTDNEKCPSHGLSYRDLLCVILPIFLLSLCLKIGFMLSVSGTPVFLFPTLDEASHDLLARDIIRTGLMREDAFYFEPLYPYLLAAFYWLFSPNMHLFKFFQAIVGACNIVLTYYLARHAFQNKGVAIIAAALTLLYGVYYFHEVLLLKTTFSVILTNSAFLLIYRATERPSLQRWLLAGCVTGLLTLLRGNTFIVLPFIFFWLVLSSFRRMIPWQSTLVFVTGIIIALLPTTIHNAVVAHDFVPTTYQGGTNFYIGNNEQSYGIYLPLRPGRSIPQYEKYDALSIAEQETGRKLKPSEVSSYWFGRSLQFITGQPTKWLRLLWAKFCLFNNNTEVPDAISYTFFKTIAPFLKITFLPFWFIFCFAAIGFMFSLSSWRSHILLYTFTASMVLSVVLFYIWSRYRLPTVSLYILFGAYGIHRIIGLLVQRKIMLLIAVIIIFVPLQRFSTAKRISFSDTETHNNIGMIYMKMGLYDKAIYHLQESARGNPGEVRIHANIARAYKLKKEWANAILEYDIVLRQLTAPGQSVNAAQRDEIVKISECLLSMLKAAGLQDRVRLTRLDLIVRYSNLIETWGGEKIAPDGTDAEVWMKKSCLRLSILCSEQGEEVTTGPCLEERQGL